MQMAIYTTSPTRWQTFFSLNMKQYSAIQTQLKLTTRASMSPKWKQISAKFPLMRKTWQRL